MSKGSQKGRGRNKYTQTVQADKRLHRHPNHWIDHYEMFQNQGLFAHFVSFEKAGLPAKSLLFRSGWFYYGISKIPMFSWDCGGLLAITQPGNQNNGRKPAGDLKSSEAKPGTRKRKEHHEKKWYGKTHCWLVRENQRRKYADRHIPRWPERYCVWIVGFLRSTLFAMENKMTELNAATILFITGVMAVAIFGIYLAHKQDKTEKPTNEE